MSEKLIEIARNIGAIGRYNDKSDVLIIMTSDQLHATIEQVCRPLEDALKRYVETGSHQTVAQLAIKTLEDHTKIMGDNK